MMDLGAVAASFILSLAAVLWLSRHRGPLAVMDPVGPRSLHQTPRPRNGGLGVLAAIGIGLALAGGGFLSQPWWLAATLPVVAVSLADDYRQVAPRWRLLAHLLAAGLVCLPGQGMVASLLPGLAPAPVWIAATVSILFLVWMTNLYNFMDGMDGLAGTMTFIGFGGLALAGWWAGQTAFAVSMGVIVAAAVGFLVWNRPPARIFLGDTGAVSLGWLAGLSVLSAHHLGVLPVWLGALMFGPFIADATLTLLARIRRGEAFWRSHRDHLYQGLVMGGWSQSRVLLLECTLMFGCVVAALWARTQEETVHWGVLAACSVALLCLQVFVPRPEVQQGR